MADGKGEVKKVMVAVDDSEYSLYALQWTLKNFTGFPGASLVLFSVQPFPDIGYLSAAYFGSPPVELIESMKKQQEKFALSLLEKAKEICAHKGVVAETHTESGDPKVVICEAVEKLKVDLLIMGSHGRGALQRAFIGSVSNYCVNNACCPVLIVKKPA